MNIEKRIEEGKRVDAIIEEMVAAQVRTQKTYAYSTGYLMSTLRNALMQLPRNHREEYLELMRGNTMKQLTEAVDKLTV